MTSSDFLSVLSAYRDFLWPRLSNVLESISSSQSLAPIPEKYQDLLDFHRKIVSDYPQRKGKYLRPFLLSTTARSMGVPLEDTINTAIAMQLSEDWILNHDDIEDDSEQRRGQPALHKIIGTDLAINAGDALHALMWHTLSRNYTKLPLNKADELQGEFYRILDRTILGQTMELKLIKESKNQVGEDTIYLISESKTGYYTIAGPMMLGAILGNATQSQLESIYKFGILLGRSFQIIDDLLDLTSDFAGHKKQKGNDIYEGKMTLMFVHLLNHIDQSQKDKLLQIYSQNRNGKSAADVDWVINKMTEYGSLEYAESKAMEFAAQAKNIFQNDLKFLSSEPYRSQLNLCIDFIVNRQY